MVKCSQCEREYKNRNALRGHINFAHLGRRPPIAVSKALALLYSRGVMRCSLCRVEKPADEFFKNKNNPTGYHTWCKPCSRGKLAPWRGSQAYRFWGIKASAKKRGIPFELTRSQLAELWQKPCSYCGAAIKTVGIDRIDSSKGYVIGNIVSCCWGCNQMKRAMSLEEFLERCKTIVRHIESSKVLKIA